MAKKIRVLVGKPGLDGHDRGAKVVAAALRDAGMEVIYTGLHQTCESIVEAAIQEDVDVIGLSILSGAHSTIFPNVLKLLKKRHARHISVIGGGIIPADDMKKLEKVGVKRLFGPGTPTTEIVEWIQSNVKGTVKKVRKKKSRRIIKTKKSKIKKLKKAKRGQKSRKKKKRKKR
jgi:methylmalonyl-CoA mutase C-terminal domain/subunit